MSFFPIVKYIERNGFTNKSQFRVGPFVHWELIQLLSLLLLWCHVSDLYCPPASKHIIREKKRCCCEREGKLKITRANEFKKKICMDKSFIINSAIFNKKTAIFNKKTRFVHFNFMVSL